MKKERIIIYIMCLLFIALGIFIMLGLKDSRECLGNPFIYGASELINEETGGVHCTCSFASPEYAPFYFTEDSIGVVEGFTKEYINVTQIID